MKTNSRICIVALLLVLVVSVPSYGWSDTGHMAVAFVAYQRLTPQARARVDALVRLNPRFSIFNSMIPAGTSAARRRMMLFMLAATWPDKIKSDGLHHADGPNNGDTPPTDGTADRNIGYSDTAMHKYWHFIDRPFSPDGTALEDPPIPNAETMIAAFRTVLASNSPDKLKSYDLVWLMHVLGDVHQPLHCTSRFTHALIHGDAGGNFVKVRDGQTTLKLHAFWDGLLGTSSSPAAAIMVGQSAPPVSPADANNLNVSDWITESFDAAKASTYMSPPIGLGTGPFVITNGYRNSARALAKKRVALAGARLANILNRELR